MGVQINTGATWSTNTGRYMMWLQLFDAVIS